MTNGRYISNHDNNNLCPSLCRKLVVREEMNGEREIAISTNGLLATMSESSAEREGKGAALTSSQRNGCAFSPISGYGKWPVICSGLLLQHFKSNRLALLHFTAGFRLNIWHIWIYIQIFKHTWGGLHICTCAIFQLFEICFLCVSKFLFVCMGLFICAFM